MNAENIRAYEIDDDGRAVIDTNQCIGCDQCAQSCPFDCIKREA